MFLIQRDGTYVDYHGRDEKSLYVPPSAFLGKTVREIMPPDLADTFMKAIEQALASDDPVVVEYELPIGAELLSFEARLVASGGDRIVAIGRDVTESKTAQLRNRELTGRLIGSQENERQRIAREMHDDLSQKLALLNMDINLLAARADSPLERMANIERLAARAAEIASDVDHLAHRLHPAKLQLLGLAAAIKSECREITQQHGVDVKFVHDDLPPVIDPNVSLCLYRITQESLHNILRHSHAREASVHLRSRSGELTLEVVDHGVGFAPPDGERAGLGLVNMRERVPFLGVQLAISSSRESGTRIVATRALRSPLISTGPAAVHRAQAVDCHLSFAHLSV
jgi:signal transduction histidine kinase